MVKLIRNYWKIRDRIFIMTTSMNNVQGDTADVIRKKIKQKALK